MIKSISAGFLLFLSFSFTQAQNTFPTAVNTDVGIGTTTPSQRFQVIGGNIDLTVTGRESYMINSAAVLWNNNDANNIFVGIGAGFTPNSSSSVAWPALSRRGCNRPGICNAVI